MDMRQQELNRLEALGQGTPSSVQNMVKEHVDWLNVQIKRIQSDIDDHIDGNPKLKHDADLMQSIPGIGRRASAQFLAYIVSVRRPHLESTVAAFTIVSTYFLVDTIDGPVKRISAPTSTATSPSLLP